MGRRKERFYTALSSYFMRLAVREWARGLAKSPRLSCKETAANYDLRTGRLLP